MGQAWDDLKKNVDFVLDDSKEKRKKIGDQYATWVKLQATLPGLAANHQAIDVRAKQLAARASKLAAGYGANSANLAAEAAQSNELKMINYELAFFYFWQSLWNLVSAVAQFFPAYKLAATILDTAVDVGGLGGEYSAYGKPKTSTAISAATNAAKTPKAAGDAAKDPKLAELLKPHCKKLQGALGRGFKAATAIMDLVSNTKKTADDWKKNGPQLGSSCKVLLAAMKDMFDVLPVLVRDPKVQKAIEETVKDAKLGPALSAIGKLITAIEKFAEGYESAAAAMQSAAAEAAAAKLSDAQLAGGGKVGLPKDLLKPNAPEDLASLSTINGVRDAERYVDELIRLTNAARDAITDRKKDLDKRLDDMQTAAGTLPVSPLQKWKTKVVAVQDKDPNVAKMQKAVIAQIEQEIAIDEQLKRDLPKSQEKK